MASPSVVEARSRCGERAWAGPGAEGSTAMGGGNQELGRGGATVYGDEIEGGKGNRDDGGRGDDAVTALLLLQLCFPEEEEVEGVEGRIVRPGGAAGRGPHLEWDGDGGGGRARRRRGEGRSGGGGGGEGAAVAQYGSGQWAGRGSCGRGRRRVAQWGRRQPRRRTDRDGKGITSGLRQDGEEAGDEDNDEAGDDDGDEDVGLVGEGLRARRGLGEEPLGGGDGDAEVDVDGGSGAGRRRRGRGSGR
nr:glycine-rich protein DOT1-like [Aegilops tauschii subsp. strangulata]